MTTDALEQYVIATGKWPSSWSELRQGVPTVRYGGIHRWPDDIPTIREFVYVDFRGDTQRLAKSTPKSFDAMKPIGPCYSSYDRHFEFLVKALRESQSY